MKITFLGTGSSHGIPVIGCECNVCKSNNERNKRLRSSLMVENNGKCFVVDVGPDFRQQMLRENVSWIDAILLTHAHKDHTAGIDDIRAYNYLQKSYIDVYAEKCVIDSIVREYEYIFAENRYPGVPELKLNEINLATFNIKGEDIIPIRAMHNKLPIFGYRFGNIAYLTDVKTIPDSEIGKLRNLDILILSVIMIKPHIAHLGLDEALELVVKLNPKQAYFTHISHRLYSYEELKNHLPANVFPAYDGLSIEI